MGDENKKKEWVEPEIISIVQCRPEESVLFACKQNIQSCGNETGPNSQLAAS